MYFVRRSMIFRHADTYFLFKSSLRSTYLSSEGSVCESVGKCGCEGVECKRVCVEIFVFVYVCLYMCMCLCVCVYTYVCM